MPCCSALPVKQAACGLPGGCLGAAFVGALTSIAPLPAVTTRPPARRSQALAPLTGLQALGLSHNLLDSWPDVVDRLPQLAVLYLGAPAGPGWLAPWPLLPAACSVFAGVPSLPTAAPTGPNPFPPPAFFAESNPGIIRLPATAAATLARLRVLSCDATVLFMNTELLTAAVRLQHLFIRCEARCRRLRSCSRCCCCLDLPLLPRGCGPTCGPACSSPFHHPHVPSHPAAAAASCGRRPPRRARWAPCSSAWPACPSSRLLRLSCRRRCITP